MNSAYFKFCSSIKFFLLALCLYETVSVQAMVQGNRFSIILRKSDVEISCFRNCQGGVLVKRFLVRPGVLRAFPNGVSFISSEKSSPKGYIFYNPTRIDYKIYKGKIRPLKINYRDYWKLSFIEIQGLPNNIEPQAAQKIGRAHANRSRKDGQINQRVRPQVRNLRVGNDNRPMKAISPVCAPKPKPLPFAWFVPPPAPSTLVPPTLIR